MLDHSNFYIVTKYILAFLQPVIEHKVWFLSFIRKLEASCIEFLLQDKK